MHTLPRILTGAVTMSFLIAALFFLRFWLRTRDGFFLLFAAAFAVYGADQFFLGWATANSEFEPLFYLPRLVTFGLIVVAVINKNRAAPGR
jgi:hypothetical protein